MDLYKTKGGGYVGMVLLIMNRKKGQKGPNVRFLRSAL